MKKAIDILDEYSIMVREYSVPHSKCKQIRAIEAIEELEKLQNEQNKTCRDCKYANLSTQRYLPIHKCDLGVNAVSIDFYCNKFVQKTKSYCEDNEVVNGK